MLTVDTFCELIFTEKHACLIELLTIGWTNTSNNTI